jgi:hypothetical protein
MTPAVRALVVAAQNLPREELYELHREVCRLAQNRRVLDVKWRESYAAGMANFRGQDEVLFTD